MQTLGQEDPLKKEMATHSSIFETRRQQVHICSNIRNSAKNKEGIGLVKKVNPSFSVRSYQKLKLTF